MLDINDGYSIIALFLALALCVCLQIPSQMSPQRSSIQTSHQMHAFQTNPKPCFAKPGEAPAMPMQSLHGPISCKHLLVSASEAQTSPSFPPPTVVVWLDKSPRESSSRRQTCSGKSREANLCTNPCRV